MPIIEVRDLYKSFNGNKVLNGIQLDVRENEILLILGPSGQGKTVLIKTMIHLLQPDSGSVFYQGIDIFSINKKKFREIQKQMAFVFQNSALFDFLNVRENLRLYLRMHTDHPDEYITRLVHDTIGFVGLENDVLDKYPEELSGGMKKRVAIARAMIKNPRCIFYDEPTNGLDKGNASKISDLIVMLKKRVSATSIIVTHDITLMEEIADRVALLKEGRIVFIGSKKELSAETLEKFYEQGENNDI
jgi:phospholipid/cholesterol/gamma-HCH transport system ATP-binding protein